MEHNREHLNSLVKKLAQSWEEEKYSLEKKIAALRKENDSFHAQIAPIKEDIIGQYLLKIKEFELLTKNEIEKELKVFKDDIKAHIASISTEDARIHSIKEEIEKLDKTITCFLAETDTLRQEKDKLLSQKQKNEEILAARKKENHELKSRQYHLEKNKNDLQSLKNSLEREFKIIDDDISNQAVSIQTEDDTKGSLKTELSNLETLNSCLSDEIGALTFERDKQLAYKQKNEETIFLKNNELEGLKEHRVSLEKRLHELQFSRNEKARELSNLRSAIESQENVISSTEERIRATKEENENIARDISKYSDEEEILKPEIENLAAYRQKNEAVSAAKKEELRVLKEHKFILEKKLDELRLSREDIDRELQLIKGDVDSQSASIANDENQIKYVKDEMLNTEKTISKTIDDTEILERKKCTLLANRKKNEEAISAGREILEELKEQHRSLNLKADSLENTKKEVLDNSASLEKEITVLREQNITLKDTHTHLMMEMAKDRQKTERLQAEIENILQQCSARKSETEKLEKECLDRETEINKLREEMTEYGVRQLERKIKELALKSDSMEDEFMRKIKDKLNLNLEKIHLNSELRKLKTPGGKENG